MKEENGKCLLSLCHKDIVNEVAAIAKKSAWTEIQNEMVAIINRGKMQTPLNLRNDK